MTVYLPMLALAIVFSLLATKYSTTTSSLNQSVLKKKSPNNLFVVLVFLCFAFVAAFRYKVGTDFLAYYKNASWIEKFNKGDYHEAGFTLFAIICDFIFGGIDGSITIGAAIFTILLFIFTIKKRAENFTLSIILFVVTGIFTGMLNGIRQYMATAILFSGYQFIIDKKPIKWLLVTLLASTFHVTAILMFFVYFACNFRCAWNLVFLYAVIAVVLLFAYEPLFDLVGVLKQEEINSNVSYMSASVNILRVLVQCVPIILLIFTDKTKINEDKEARFLLNICLLNAAIAVAAMNSAYLSRFWIYTSCFQVLMYPKIFNKMQNENKKFFMGFMILFYVAFWVYEIMNAPILYNYSWIFKYL